MRALSSPTVQQLSPPLNHQRRVMVQSKLKQNMVGRRLLVMLVSAILCTTASTLRVLWKTTNALKEICVDSCNVPVNSLLVKNWERRARRRQQRPVVRDSDLQSYEILSRMSLEADQDWTTSQGRHMDLCGSHAQSASQRHPGSFPSSDALNQASRVVISGLFSPIGVRLAMRLVEQCGVHQIIGIDDLMPNTRGYRMEQMERYAILMRLIPKLRLFLPHSGILPKAPLHERLESFGPTHMVHLYNLDDSSTNPLYYLRNSMMSMDQIFGIAKKLTVMPNIVYIPSAQMELDHLIARTYHGLFGLASTGLQIPQVYGPWGRGNSWTFSLGELIMRNITIPSDVVIPPDDEPLLFVDDAVNAVLVAMQFRRGAVSFQLGSHTTKADIERAIMSLEYPVTMRVRRPNMYIEDWLGWDPVTSNLEGAKKLLAWHYNRAYPYGRISPSNEPHFEPLQRQPFPCASECSLPSDCQKSVMDDVATISKAITHGCKYALYMVNLWEGVEGLPVSVPAEGSDSTTCQIAFVSGASPLVKEVRKDGANGLVKSNGWSLVWTSNETSQLSDADLALPKLSPGKLFSNTVSRAFFVDVDRVTVPTMDSLLELIRVLDAPSRKAKKKKEFRSGTTLYNFRWTPPQAARTVILFGQQQQFPFPEVNQMTKYLNFISKRDSFQLSPRFSRQIQFYDQVAHFVQVNERRTQEEIDSFSSPTFPYLWVHSTLLMHNLREEGGRLLRCEWYDEQIFWGHSDLNDFSLAYILAKRRILGQLGPAIIGQREWIPLLVAGSEERLQNVDGKELFIRLLPSTKLFPQNRPTDATVQ